MNKLKICEIFKSIQGESTWAGHVCSFIRLSGCNLRCTYCDTTYAFDEYSEISIPSILDTISKHKSTIVEITGGEPLSQNWTPQLCDLLLRERYTVLVETNGSLDISVLPEGCRRIVDVKCPGSGAAHSFLEKNISLLTQYDEIKYVISSRDDFEWALKHEKTYNLHKTCTVLFSPNLSMVAPRDCASWIIDSNAPVRLGLQLHRFIWGNMRGV